MATPKIPSLVPIGIATALLTACTALQPAQDPYGDAWKQVVSSGQWASSLKAAPPESPVEHERHYAIPSYSPLESTLATPEFMQQYPAMVSWAYFRLIGEALEADRRVAKTYQELYRKAGLSESKTDAALQGEFEMARRRFEAHREMLEGLRSWKAFNEFGSDDLNFFMQEQLPVSYEMFQRGVRQDKIIDHLMRGLADLYHRQYGGLDPDDFFSGTTG
jgi:hypothetical protein